MIEQAGVKLKSFLCVYSSTFTNPPYPLRRCLYANADVSLISLGQLPLCKYQSASAHWGAGQRKGILWCRKIGVNDGGSWAKL